ncbi:MAG: ABC transporter ATP-binding protein [Clostridia bacterium]|nr:ABC transporter ATP-binding protein [Clostridia bacterium]
MISVKNLTKAYGEKVVYKDFNIDIEENKILVVLGESGSGKTTLLNVLAGLTDYEGQITGEISSVSMLFQKDFLVPNLTVEQNLSLVCDGDRGLKMLEKFGLLQSAKNYPKSLSAGMSRRVALIRAMLYKSSLLLMDEPTNSLDIALKKLTYEMVKKQKFDDKKTVVIVTHDVDEALSLADRVVVLKNGELVYSYNFKTDLTNRDITGEECNAVRKNLIDNLLGNKI